jgi:signal peptidase II
MRLPLYGLTAAAVLAAAQAANYLVMSRLGVYESHHVAGMLHLTHVRNTGGIFGSFQGNSAVFAAVGVALIAGLTWYLVRNPSLARYQYACFGLIAGAAASNVFDRLLYGSVVDYIDIRGIPYWHYVFNVADMAIHLGVWPLAIGTFFGREERSAEPGDSGVGAADSRPGTATEREGG